MKAGWLVSGRVQGVGYRYFVLLEATRLGLGGWVRNLPDGRVEVMAEGPDDGLLELGASLSTGPRHSQVADLAVIEISDEIVIGKIFEIK